MLSIIQIILSIIIITLILIQQRGAEGGILFGSQTQFFLKRRGLEKNLYYFTWLVIILFVFVSLLKIIS
jgi:protein translocase SecG subunit